MIIKRNFNREQIYWICQLLGWGGFILINVLFTFFIKGETGQNYVILPAYFVLGIGLTHTYRTYIKKNKWQNLPVKKLITNVFLSNLLIAALIVIVFYLLITAFSLSSRQFSFIYIVISVFNVFISNVLFKRLS